MAHLPSLQRRLRPRARGNPLRDNFPDGSFWNLTYDRESRLIRVDKSNGEFDTHVWNGDGLRVQTGPGNLATGVGSTTKFFLDGVQAIWEGTTDKGAATARHIPGLGSFSTVIGDDGIARSKWIYLGEDAAGSTIREITTLGRSAAGGTASLCDAYGRTVWSTGAATPRRWKGAHGYQSERSVMTLLGARFHLPQLGRFLNQDPIGQAGGPNLHAYCDNSPLTKVDPTGKYEVRLGFHDVTRFGLHTWVMVTDNVRGSKTYGWSWSFSAGPERMDLFDPGRLIDGSGLSTPRQMDSLANWPDQRRFLLDQNHLPVAPLLNHLRTMRSELARWNVGYRLLEGPNSNSFTGFILNSINAYDGRYSVRTRADRTVRWYGNRFAQLPAGWRYGNRR